MNTVLENTESSNALKPMLPAVKGGRAFNGNHKDKGLIVHYVYEMTNYSEGDWFNKSLCGTEPNERSYGWTKTDKNVNCKKCLKKLVNKN
jgi:hypothetical protein